MTSARVRERLTGVIRACIRVARMRVVVAGGGLVGLTLAALLRRRGVEPHVVERMPAGVYVKRGFMLGHQGYDAIADVGVLDQITAAGRPIGAMPDGRSAATAIEVGRVLAAVGEDVPVLHEHTVPLASLQPA